MVKPLKIKISILEKLKAKKFPPGQRGQAQVLPSDKGEYLGSCNRSACLQPGADWFNHSTRRYYCADCAHWLNCDKFNKQDAMAMYGHDLCTLDPPQENSMKG